MEVSDRLFKRVLLLFALSAPVLLLASLWTLFGGFDDAFEVMGWRFFWTTEWDPVTQTYGGLVFLVGTLLTSFIALAISFPFSLAISIFTGEIIRGTKASIIISNLIEIIAAIPSVVIGMWAIFSFVPVMQQIQLRFDFIPYGTGLLTTCIVLAFMIIPFSAALGREVISLVPNHVKEAAYAMGATRMEVVLHVILPYCRSGIISGFILSTARALGETMAVTMLIGNVNHFPTGLLAPTNTMASIIANEFAEATDDTYYSALIGVGLMLLIGSILLSFIARRVIKRFIV